MPRGDDRPDPRPKRPTRTEGGIPERVPGATVEAPPQRGMLMLRALLSSVIALALLAGAAVAKQDDKQTADTKANRNLDKSGTKAVITNADPDKGTITLKYKDEDGKEV